MTPLLTDYTINALLADLVMRGYQQAEIIDDPALGVAVQPHSLVCKGLPYWSLTFYRCPDTGIPKRQLCIHPAVSDSKGEQLGDDVAIRAFFDASGLLTDWQLCESYAGTCTPLEAPETIGVDALPGLIRAWDDALEGL
jgi:hypothetical protein